jgi:DNA polymerase-3 subunit alpha
MSIKALVSRARETGAPAVALTDHGNLMGFFEFMKEAKEQGIKPIPGVEAYYFTGKDDSGLRPEKRMKRHLILMAKDADGFKAISKAVTRSKDFIDYGYPRMNDGVLKEMFGPGSLGHGHVFATSACVNGVIAGILLADDTAKTEASKIRRKRDEHRKPDSEYFKVKKEIEDADAEISRLMTLRDETVAKAKSISLVGLRRAAKAAKDGDKEAAEKALFDGEKRKKELEDLLKKTKADTARKKAARTALMGRFRPIAESVSKWERDEAKAASAEATVKGEEVLYSEAMDAAKAFSAIFGEGNFFLELQYHGMESERRIMPIIERIAEETGLPVVAANDAHYATCSADDVKARDLVKSTRFGGTAGMEEDEEGHGELYVKSDAELSEALSRILKKKTVITAMENIGMIARAVNVEIPKGKHYPAFVGGKEGETASQRLERLAKEGIKERYPEEGSFTEEHERRLMHELSVIGACGFSDYLCIVQDFLRHGRTFAGETSEGVGYTVGPGRGSAVGSLVCYLTGITSVDPMRHDLLFERFLNTERVSQPDIDSDFHTEVRGKVLEYVKSKYGEDAVCQIATKGTMAAKLAVRTAGRATGVAQSLVDRVAGMIPQGPNVKLKDASEELSALMKENAVAGKLVEDALLIEGRVISFGTHAAGVIIADNGDVSEYVPLMAGDKGVCCQCDMFQAEEDAGLLKMDFLGLKNLDVITETVRAVKRGAGVSIDIEKVPFEDEVFEEIFAKGNTNSVFQFESSGMKEMLRRFRPTSIDDLILLVAAYRPGPMKYIEDITEVKNGRRKAAYIVPELKPILSVTYGKAIFQEQVMQIFNRVAGFSLGEADVIRRAMGKKKMSILTDPKTDYQGKFIAGLTDRGASRKDAEAFWEELLDFANYAFNKSHAAAYAYIAYYTAWLKHRYPAEYQCAVMERAPHAKLPMLLAETRKMGLSVKGPDINLSGTGFGTDGSTVRFGLAGIKGVASASATVIGERARGGRFTSVKDFMRRVNVNKGVIQALTESGSLDSFCGGERLALLESLDRLTDLAGKIRKKEAELAELLGAETPDEKRIKNREKALTALNGDLLGMTFYSDRKQPRREKLERERELLGLYVSGHPLEDYEFAISGERATDIAEITDGNVKVCGIVSDFEVKQRKKDGAPFALFTLSDRSGEVSVKCYTKQYAEYADELGRGNGTVISVTGKTETVREENDDGEETVIDSSVVVKKIKRLMPSGTGSVVLSVPDITEWNRIHELIKPHIDAAGLSCTVYDEALSEMRKCEFRVLDSVASVRADGLRVTINE